MFELNEFLDHFDRVRQRTRRVADCIPAEHVEWTYKTGAFTLGDLVRHLAVTERYIWAETVHNRPVAYVTHGRELADGRDAVLAFLDRMHAESMALFSRAPARGALRQMPDAGWDPDDDVEVAADDDGARDSSSRANLYLAWHAECRDAAAVRDDRSPSAGDREPSLLINEPTVSGRCRRCLARSAP